MNWLNPGALWLMGLTGLVGAIYFLRRRARAYPVSALFLWSGSQEQPHSFLRWLWSRIGLLLLQLAALALLVTALADPVIYAPSRGELVLALLIDGSASMGARLAQGQRTRYQQAVAEAAELLARNPAARTVVIQAQRRSRLLADMHSSRAQVLEALRSSQPTYEGNADPAELLQLLRSQAELSSFEQILLFTDHAPPPALSQLGWQVRPIGGAHPVENLALTRFSARRQPDGHGYDLFVEMQNATQEPQQAHLQISLDGRPIIERALTLAAGERRAESLDYPKLVQASAPPRFSASLSSAAAEPFIADNRRYALPPQRKPLSILWVGQTQPLLELALRALFAASLTRSQSLALGESVAQYDLIVAYRTTLPSELSGHLLLLDAGYPGLVSLGKEQPAGGGWQAQRSPILAAVRPEEIVVDKVRATQLAPQGQTLLRAGQWPALYLYEAPGLRLAALPFSLELDNSNLLLTVDFPILLTQLINWLLPQRERPAQLTSGAELPLQQMGPGPTQLIGPGEEQCLYQDAPTQTRCGLVEQPGFYLAKSGSVTQVFAVNLPASESQDLASNGPSQHPAAGADAGRALEPATGQSERQGAPPRATRPLWPLLLLGGLALLALELAAFDHWFWPHRPLSRRHS